ncbi:vacuolar membrane protein-related, putative [Plasmodium relictum]|uniref:Vacuolar membrane protein-related, putative n=1 Tax=Plasmodium relictum TaxID=85471 RepID=A0A1J1H615_PLARL|nr:vacuolar membrane protein-related, putative [Plasmodium relictum]CRH00121.1 vacuolar membrane protein-related, putative [Plasmodium relictum]
MLKIKNKINLINFISKRYYTNNSKGISKEYVYTKYRISLPYINNVKYDDLYLSRPNKEDLYVFTKKIPIFLRFLKLITSLENRNKDFIEFAKRCENGLTIEKDVYLTKEELLELMFINGYSKKEMNAFDLAFNNNYEFHYPEISVLFQLDEEDVYKFCLKKRSEYPEKLFHLKFLKDKNMLSSYGLIFVFLYFGLNNVVLSNAWFLSKTIPFFSVFYMLASYFYKDIWNFLNKEKNLMIEQNMNNKLLAEDIIYNQLKLYSKDTDCSSNLINFKDYSNKLINNYRKAYINEQKKKVQENLEKKLNEIYNIEMNYKNSLQNILLEEIIKKIYHNIKTDNNFYNSILNDSINNIRNINENDTLINHVRNELDSIKSLNKQNPLIKNILNQYELKKEEYLNQYAIQKEEVDKIKNIINKCNMNINKLNTNDYNDLLNLFHNINNRFGFYVNDDEVSKLTPRDEESKKIIDNINKAIYDTNKSFNEKKLVAFLKAFQ